MPRHDAAALLAGTDLAGVSGWLVYALTERPEWFRSHGIPHPARFRQMHLDWVMMGLIQIAVQQVAPDMPGWIRASIAFGTVVNPLLFAPLAWATTSSRTRSTWRSGWCRSCR